MNLVVDPADLVDDIVLDEEDQDEDLETLSPEEDEHLHGQYTILDYSIRALNVEETEVYLSLWNTQSMRVSFATRWELASADTRRAVVEAGAMILSQVMAVVIALPETHPDRADALAEYRDAVIHAERVIRARKNINQ